MKTKGELTREKILEVARELFNSKGFNATTISDLVAATGMQKGSLYFHFAGKDAIAREVLSEATAEFMAFLTKALGGQNPGACIDNFFRCALEKHLGTGFVGGCIFGNTALEMSDFDPEFAGAIDAVFDEWINRVDVVIAAAQKSGQIRTDISSEALSNPISANLQPWAMRHILSWPWCKVSWKDSRSRRAIHGNKSSSVSTGTQFKRISRSIRHRSPM